MAFESGQNVYRVEILETLSDHQGNFQSFVDCFKEGLEKLMGQDDIIVCFDSMKSGHPHRDVYTYNPQIGVESLRAAFEEDYKDGINLGSVPSKTEQ